MKKLTDRLDSELYRLHKACWNKKDKQFDRDSVRRLNKRVVRLRKEGWDVREYEHIVMGYYEAMR